MKYNLVLGSKSPRRKELLKTLFVNFKIEVSNIEETSECSLAKDYVQEIASQKARSVFDNCVDNISNPVVIGADTIVVLGNEILGKPKDKADAASMLKRLSGRSHKVLTAVCIITGKAQECFYDETSVTFEKISDDLLELYLDTNESMDKAGAYGIQAYALSFIKEIQGSYSNVVGLPVNKVLASLESLFKDSGVEWRKKFE